MSERELQGESGLTQWCPTTFTTDINTRDAIYYHSSVTRLAKPTNNIQITLRTSVVERGPAIAILTVNICPLWKEILDNVQVTI